MRHVVPRVDDLHHPEPLPHVRHRKDHRFLRQIQLRHRVERVDVEPDHGSIRGVGKRSIVNELVDRGTGLVDFGHMRGRVDLDLDVDEWHAKDPGLLRDGLRFVGRDGRLLVLSHECCLSAIGFDRLVDAGCGSGLCAKELAAIVLVAGR